MEPEKTEEELEEESIEPEIVTTTDAPHLISYAEEEQPPTKLKKKKGTISIKHKMLANMAARSYPVSIIAQELHMKESTVYHLLEKNEEIWDEINRVIDSIFAEGDRLVASLRIKALIKLDEQLNSPNEDVKDKAITKILKITDDRSGNKTAIFVGGGKSQQGIESVDELILRMRKDRGLPMPKKPKEVEE